MDWFEQEENIFQNESLSNENLFDIENVFLKKQENFHDYDLKLEEFMLNNKEIQVDACNHLNTEFLVQNKNNEVSDEQTRVKLGNNYSGTKLFAVERNDKPSDIFQSKLDKTKSKKKKTKNLQLTKEEYDKHPFLNFPRRSGSNNLVDADMSSQAASGKVYYSTFEENSYSLKEESENIKREHENVSFNDEDCASMVPDNNSHYHRNINIEEEVRRNLLFNSQEDQSHAQNQILYNMSLCNGTNPCPFDYYISLKNLPISERMKIKKEKTKLLLERKTKREHFHTYREEGKFSEKVRTTPYSKIKELPNNSPNAHSSKSDNTKSTGVQSNNLSQFKNISDLLNNPSVINYLSSSGDDYLNNLLNNSQLSKKEKKMLRNRISAQRSRDRKKKEMDDMKVISQDLLNQNTQMNKELEVKNKEIADLKEKINKICQNCQLLFTDGNRINNTVSGTQRLSIVDSNRNFSSSLKYSVVAGLLVIVCLIGVFSFSTNEKNINNFQGRILASLADKSLTDENKDSYDELIQSTPMENSVVLYNTGRPPNSQLNKPKIFSISKDIQKYIKMKTKYINPVKSLPSSPQTMDVETNEEEKEIEMTNSFLSKKRIEFLYKMTKRRPEVSGFLQKTNQMCVNVDGLDWSIKKENDIMQQESKFEIIPSSDDENLKEIVLKTNNVNSDSTTKELNNQIIPVQDIRYNNLENSLMRDNIKSMYCRDFMTSTEDNEQMFKNMFNQLNSEILQGKANSGYKSKDEDCLYLHMIVPSSEELEMDNIKLSDYGENTFNSDDNQREAKQDNATSSSERKVYYEVGCKIFEINKIYK